MIISQLSAVQVINYAIHVCILADAYAPIVFLYTLNRDRDTTYSGEEHIRADCDASDPSEFNEQDRRLAIIRTVWARLLAMDHCRWETNAARNFSSVPRTQERSGGEQPVDPEEI